MTEISRRDIVAGSAALALTTTSTSAFAQQRARAAPAGPTNVINLECGFITKTIDGIQCRLRAYNGTIPGPLMQIAPGQKLTINLKNSLAPYTYGAANWPHDHNVPHNLGSTNLHLHGLDIIPHLFEPVGTSDPEGRDDRDQAGRNQAICLPDPDRSPARIRLVSSAPSRLDGGAGGYRHGRRHCGFRRHRRGAGDQGGAPGISGDPGHRPVSDRPCGAAGT